MYNTHIQVHLFCIYLYNLLHTHPHTTCTQPVIRVSTDTDTRYMYTTKRHTINHVYIYYMYVHTVFTIDTHIVYVILHVVYICMVHYIYI